MEFLFSQKIDLNKAADEALTNSNCRDLISPANLFLLFGPNCILIMAALIHQYWDPSRRNWILTQRLHYPDHPSTQHSQASYGSSELLATTLAPSFSR